jgi:tripeptidyl-peptidase I
MPDHVREHIELIKPTVHFVHHIPDDPTLLRKRFDNKLGMPSDKTGPKTNGVKVTESDLLSIANCDKFITPDCLRALYEIDYEPEVPHLNSFGIGMFSVDRLFCTLF